MEQKGDVDCGESLSTFGTTFESAKNKQAGIFVLLRFNL